MVTLVAPAWTPQGLTRPIQCSCIGLVGWLAVPAPGQHRTARAPRPQQGKAEYKYGYPAVGLLDSVQVALLRSTALGPIIARTRARTSPRARLVLYPPIPRR